MNISFVKHTGSFRKGFMIGENNPFSDVVFDGVPLPLWRPTTSHKVNEYQFKEIFFLSLNGTNDTQMIGAPEVQFFFFLFLTQSKKRRN